MSCVRTPALVGWRLALSAVVPLGEEVGESIEGDVVAGVQVRRSTVRSRAGECPARATGKPRAQVVTSVTGGLRVVPDVEAVTTVLRVRYSIGIAGGRLVQAA